MGKMATDESSTPRVVEVRVITHAPSPVVAILFSNGTSSACGQEFQNFEAAEHFAAGLRAGLDWQARLISASIVEMIERDFIVDKEAT